MQKSLTHFEVVQLYFVPFSTDIPQLENWTQKTEVFFGVHIGALSFTHSYQLGEHITVLSLLTFYHPQSTCTTFYLLDFMNLLRDPNQRRLCKKT